MTAFLWLMFVSYVVRTTVCCSDLEIPHSRNPDAIGAVVNLLMAVWVGFLLFG